MKSICNENGIGSISTNNHNCYLDCCYPVFNIQNAIANIIYAQGEEIKKVVSFADNTSCILEINELVNTNIHLLTIFENSLLDNFKCCCNFTPLKPTCNCDVDGGVF